VSGLGSAPVPPVAPDDHVRGAGEAAPRIVYADYECPYCAVLCRRLAGTGERWAFRHFPVKSKHPRAWAAACAAEAAGLQGRFWEMHDALFADQGRLEDPHLWAHAEALGLDVERFDADRRSDAVAARVRRDFESGVRAGVVTTPTAFVDGGVESGPEAALG
jgi:protein-disulfide isomerase